MATPNLRTRSGNRIRVLMDGKEVGLAQDVRGSDDYGPEPASGVGDIHVQEYVPSLARHTVTASQMLLNLGTFRDQGITLENGDDALRGMVFDIEVFDKDSGSLLRKYISCSMASGDVDIRKHAIMVSNATFNALDVTGKSI